MMAIWLVSFEFLAIIWHHSPNALDIFLPIIWSFDESFTLFLINVSTIFQKIVQMNMKKIHFHTHFDRQLLLGLYQLISQVSVVAFFSIYKELLNHWFEGCPSSWSASFIDSTKCMDLKSFHFFSTPMPVKVLPKHSKHLLSLSSVLINCFTNHILIIRRGNIIFSLRIRGLASTFLSPGFNSALKDNYFLT